MSLLISDANQRKNIPSPYYFIVLIFLIPFAPDIYLLLLVHA